MNNLYINVYTVAVIDPQLQLYLQEAKTANVSLDDVTTELVKAGWSNEQILEAQSSYTGKPLPLTTPINSQTNTATLSPKKPFNWKIASIAITLLIFVLLSGTGVYAYMLAADKVSSESDFIERMADKIALNVPFFPKTPKMVLTEAMISHQLVTQNSFDFSLVATSNDFQSVIGVNELDVQLTGYTDVNDFKNPKFDVTGNITKDFSFQIKKNDPVLYFKILKVPSLILSMIGVDEEKLKPVLENWVSYDTTPLETEARKSLEELDSENEKEDIIVTISEKMQNNNILPNLEMEREKLDGLDTYKINFQPSDELLDVLSTSLDEEFSSNNKYQQVLGTSTMYLGEEPKLSDVIKKFNVTMWIDTKEYYVRKVTLSFDVQSNDLNPGASATLENLPIPTTTTSPMTVVSVLKMSDFGKTIAIDLPTSSIPLEEFYEKLSEAMWGGSFGTGMSTSRTPSTPEANNAMRRSDVESIISALMRYRAFQGNLPAGITNAHQEISSFGANICGDLLREELKRLPTDPFSSLGGSEITDCTGRYDSGYFVSVDANNKLTVSAPMAELGETISISE